MLVGVHESPQKHGAYGAGLGFRAIQITGERSFDCCRGSSGDTDELAAGQHATRVVACLDGPVARCARE